MSILKSLSIFYYISMALVLVGVVMQLAQVPNATYIFTTGALYIFGIRTYNVIVGKPDRKRILTILLVSSVFMLAAAYAMFTYRNYWIVLLLITAMLDSYSSWKVK